MNLQKTLLVSLLLLNLTLTPSEQTQPNAPTTPTTPFWEKFTRHAKAEFCQLARVIKDALAHTSDSEEDDSNPLSTISIRHIKRIPDEQSDVSDRSAPAAPLSPTGQHHTQRSKTPSPTHASQQPLTLQKRSETPPQTPIVTDQNALSLTTPNLAERSLRRLSSREGFDMCATTPRNNN